MGLHLDHLAVRVCVALHPHSERTNLSRMDPLEQRALKKDRRFIVRLLLTLAIGIVAGILLFSQLTGTGIADCAARSFGAVTQE